MPWPRSNTPMAPGWAKRRARVLAGDPACAVCKRRAATEVDHVTPRHLGGAGGALRPICRTCHGKVTQRQSMAVRRAVDPVEGQRRRAAKRGRKQEAEFWEEIKRR